MLGVEVVVGLVVGHWGAGKHAGGKASRKRVANGGRMARLSSSWTAGSDNLHWTCTSWWWTCPLCSWWVEGEVDGEAEGVELHGVEVEPLVILYRQKLLVLLLRAGQGLRAGACDLKLTRREKWRHTKGFHFNNNNNNKITQSINTPRERLLPRGWLTGKGGIGLSSLGILEPTGSVKKKMLKKNYI